MLLLLIIVLLLMGGGFGYGGYRSQWANPGYNYGGGGLLLLILILFLLFGVPHFGRY